MASRLKRHLDLMKVLYKSPPNLQRAILKEVENDVIVCLSDCCHNVLKGNLKLSAKQKKDLKKYKRQLHQLASKATTVSKKRKILVQSGGLPFALLAPIISIAGTLLLDALRK